MEYPEQYLAGIALFNDRKFWHAHEEWEEAWRATADPQTRLFYKGIIQTTAALVHWQKGNPRGLQLNWAKARSKLTQLPSSFMGLPLDDLIGYMDRFVDSEGRNLAPPQLSMNNGPMRDRQ
jgi:uncharacterized protein